MNNWVKIFEASDIFKAELVVGMLEEHGIKSTILNKRDSAYAFGLIEIYTAKENAMEAANLIKIENPDA